MTDPVKEQLSACLDGELPEAELGLLLKQVARDRPLLDSLSRYSLISEAMRDAKPIAASASFADRIAAAIEAEPVPQAAPRSRIPSLASMQWLRPAAGLAIAAGVAAVAVMAVQPQSVETQQVAAVADSTIQETAQVAPSYTVPTNVNASADAGFIPAARLTNYVVAHSEYSTPLGRRSVLSGVLSEDEGQQDDAEVAVNVSGGDAATEPQP